MSSALDFLYTILYSHFSLSLSIYPSHAQEHFSIAISGRTKRLSRALAAHAAAPCVDGRQERRCHRRRFHYRRAAANHLRAILFFPRGFHRRRRRPRVLSRFR